MHIDPVALVMIFTVLWNFGFVAKFTGKDKNEESTEVDLFLLHKIINSNDHIVSLLRII